LSETAGAAGLKSSKSLPELVGDIVGTGLSFISVIFFILMLYGGFLWMTARGNSDQETKAKDTIFGAIIGIIIVLSAYAITSFVFKNLGAGNSGDSSSSGAVAPAGSGTGTSGGAGTGGATPPAVVVKDKDSCTISNNDWAGTSVTLVGQSGVINCASKPGDVCPEEKKNNCQPLCRYHNAGAKCYSGATCPSGTKVAADTKGTCPVSGTVCCV
jgi:hypothetical protein